MAFWNDEIPGLSKKSIFLQVSFWLLFIPFEIGLAEILGLKDSFTSYLLHYMLYLTLFYWHSYGLFLKNINSSGVRVVPLVSGLLLELLVFYLFCCLIRILLDGNSNPDLSVFYSLKSIAAILYRFGYMAGMATTFWLGLFSAQQLKNIHAMEKQQLENELQKENLKVALLQSELAFLKAQIQPHFLLNALNKIYAQTRHQAPVAGATIMAVTQLLSYHLVRDSKQQETILAEELDYISKYIQLQYVLTPLHLIFTVPANTYLLARETPFPAFILSTLVENIFKHAILDDHTRPSKLLIKLNNNKLRIRISNYFASDRNKNKGGIGLENIRQRLERSYGSDFTSYTHVYRQRYTFKLYVLLNTD